MGVSYPSASRELAPLASAKGLREAILHLSRDKQWINEKHLELCRIPSPTFQEQRRAEWMLAAFRQLGCDADRKSTRLNSSH